MFNPAETPAHEHMFHAGDGLENVAVKLYSGFVIEGGEFTGCEVVVAAFICAELITLTLLTEVLDNALLVGGVPVSF